MDDSVNSGSEQTLPEESQTSEEQSTNDEPEVEDSSSGEDVNAQSEDEGEELVEGAMNEVKAEKSRNRVQELANQNRSLKQELDQIRQQQLYQSYQNQPQDQNEYIANELARQQVQLQQTREEMVWERAARSYPELDPTSEDYSREFSDLVYSNYLIRQQKGEAGITPALVAKETKDYLSRLTGKAAAQSDVVRQVKKTVTPLGGKRTESAKEYSIYQERKSRFKESGSIDDLADLLDEVA